MFEPLVVLFIINIVSIIYARLEQVPRLSSIKSSVALNEWDSFDPRFLNLREFLFLMKVLLVMFFYALDLILAIGKSAILEPVSRFRLFLRFRNNITFFHHFPFRSSHRMCSVRKDVLRNVAKFTGKHLRQSLFFFSFRSETCNFI